MRCFIALPLPEAAREVLAKAAAAFRRDLAQSLKATPGTAAGAHSAPSLSWTRSEAFHITLAFLGELEERAAQAAARSLDAASGFGSIRFGFAGFSGFGRNGHPGSTWRVLFAALEDGGRSAALYRLVNEALASEAKKAELGPLNPEWPDTWPGQRQGQRPFLAHVTLARARHGSLSTVAMPDAGGLAGEWTLERCVLYKSELRRAGSVYTELRGVDLG